MSLSMDKRSIRAALLQQRLALTATQTSLLGHAAQVRVLELSYFRKATTVALYSAVRNEVDTTLLAEAALAAGKSLCFPCVNGEEMHFYPVNSLDELQEGCFGVCEPQPAEMEVAAAQIDFMLVPGVAFDLSGHRLGYGRGFFDRFLEGAGFYGQRVGLAYDFQVVERLPAEEHDQMVDLLVTEARIITPP